MKRIALSLLILLTCIAGYSQKIQLSKDATIEVAGKISKASEADILKYALKKFGSTERESIKTLLTWGPDHTYKVRDMMICILPPRPMKIADKYRLVKHKASLDAYAQKNPNLFRNYLKRIGKYDVLFSEIWSPIPDGQDLISYSVLNETYTKMLSGSIPYSRVDSLNAKQIVEEVVEGLKF